ncbi:MAG: hypothetical protein ACLGXA_05190 [Acidobacteriota bacterium]
MQDLLARAVRREMNGGDTPQGSWSHRVPMGLMLIEQGRITPDQLESALRAQRREAEFGETPRLGEWLLRSGVLSEPALTRALSAQWNCPVLSLAAFQPSETAAVMPSLFSEIFDAVPVWSAGGGRLHLAFAGRLDRSLSYAVERMTGLPVAAGIARDSEFRRAQEKLLAGQGATVRHLEAADSWALVRAMTRWIEEARPVESRLVRVHDYYWLRIWRRRPGPGPTSREDVEDLTAVVSRGGVPGRRPQG